MRRGDRRRSGSSLRCSPSTRCCSSRSPGLRCRARSANYFFGPKLVRAEVLVKDGGVLHVYRVDRGTIRDKAGGTLTLRERDGTLVPIAVAPTASITLDGRPAAYSDAPSRYGRDRDSGRRRTGVRGPRRPADDRGEAAELHPAGTPGPQLLLVEDEDSIGSLVSAYLEQTGYRVAWVRSGEEALQTLDDVRPRLVILDIGLPGAGRLRRLPRHPGALGRADPDADRAGRGGRPRRRARGRRRRLRHEAVLAARARRPRQGSPAPHRARRAAPKLLELGDIAARPAGPRGHASPARPSS